MEQKCYERIAAVTDDQSFYEINAEPNGAVVTGYARIGNAPVYIFAQNPECDGGAMTKTQGEKLCKLYDLAAETGLPIVAIYDCAGGKLDEGLYCLEAYGKVLAKINRVSGVVPQFSIVDGVCNGCTALLSVSADVVIRTDNAKIYLTADDKNCAPDEANSAQISVTDINEAADVLKNLVMAFPSNNLDVIPALEPSEPNSDCKHICGKVMDADAKIQLSKNFGKSSVTVLARLNGESVGVINFDAEDGIISADDCTKAARFIRMCDSFSIPIITFVNAKRFGGGEANQVRAAAVLAHSYAEATTVKISVAYGYACGAVFAATCLGLADAVVALNTAKISVVSPEVAVLAQKSDLRAEGKSLKELVSEYEAENCTATAAAKAGIVSDIVTESELRGRLITLCEMLSGKRVSGLDKKHSNMPL